MTFRQAGGCLALTVALVCAASAQSGVQADKQFQAALHKENVDGDLKAAIEEYRKISTRPGVGREVAATSLVRMAECYRKLGDAQAREIYAQVVREFADQAIAGEARAQLAAMGAGRAVNGATQGDPARDVETVWHGPDVNTKGSISLDGRRLSYADRKTGDLAIRDLTTGSSRRLTAGPGDFSDFAFASAISRDGKQVAYSWYVEKTGRDGLRILPIDATPATAPRVTVDNPEIDSITPHDWSPDGQWIAATFERHDRTTQIGLLATKDLSLRVLKTVDWRGPTKMLFSPDGRYLAYDLRVGESSMQRDVFVISVDGSREIEAVAHSSYDVVMGWAPNGRSLLFASNRTGPMGLWSLPISDGKPTGVAMLLRPDIGPVSDSLGVLASGTLVLGLQTGGPNIYTATMNPESGKLLTPVTPLVDGFLRSNREPAWSPDGKSIVYLSIPANGPSSLVVHSIEDGRTREVQPMMGWFLRPTWAPDGSIYVSGSDVKGRRGVHRVDLATGSVSQVVVGAAGRCPENPSLSLDGRVLVYLMQCQPESAVIVRDVASAVEREVARARGVGTPKVSPDGTHVAYLRWDEPTKSKSLLVVPTTGGAPRELMRTTDPVVLGSFVEWSADGRRLLTSKVDRTSTKSRAMLVPLDGGMPVELDAAIPGFRVALHPDGRRLAFGQGQSAFEIRTVSLLATTTQIRR